MGHTHADSNHVSINVTHIHPSTGLYTSVTNCGNPLNRTHQHTYGQSLADSHNHTVTLSYSSADLGVPNWWNHTHPYNLTVCLSGGANHSHITADKVTGSSGCTYGVPKCNTAGHTHNGTLRDAIVDGAHTDHTCAGSTTDADPAGTPDNHRHQLFPATVIWLSSAGSHGHGIASGSIANAICLYSYSHNHTIANLPAQSHPHSIDGDEYSGWGGESAGQPYILRVQLVDGMSSYRGRSLGV